ARAADHGGRAGLLCGGAVAAAQRRRCSRRAALAFHRHEPVRRHGGAATGGETLRLVQTLADLTAIHEEKLLNRAPGLTYEPSWLATQIVLLMLPPLV